MLQQLRHLVKIGHELLRLHRQQPIVRCVMLTVMLGEGGLVAELAEDFTLD